MRRILAALLCLCLCAMPVRAQAPSYIALTFDDGPTKYTPALLAGLEEREVKATFFLSGYRIDQFPELAEQIQAAGHEIGLHGQTHRRLDNLSRRDIAAEIVENRALLPAGCKARWLRPPEGRCPTSVCQVAKAKNLGVLIWSVDPRDWECDDAGCIARRVVETVRDGDVVLLHDTSESSVQAALAIVEDLTARGYRFVTVSELARLRGESIRSGKVYRNFYPREEK